jgi:3-hydroxyacyl-CoA dehydrogenase
VEKILREFQSLNQRLRFSSCPTVVAARGLTLGGGCEVAMGADHVVAAAETYIGLVELGAGVIPGGGGCKELVKRADERIPPGVQLDPFPYVRWIFETVGMARVATSAAEAVELGFLRATDKMVMNADHLLHHAKNAVLALDRAGYAPSLPRHDIRVLGKPGLATLESAVYNMGNAGFASPYDQILARELAWILTGGDLTGPSTVSEAYLLELEVQAFMRLCHDERTQARMAHILNTGKPLRN